MTRRVRKIEAGPETILLVIVWVTILLIVCKAVEVWQWTEAQVHQVILTLGLR